MEDVFRAIDLQMQRIEIAEGVSFSTFSLRRTNNDKYVQSLVYCLNIVLPRPPLSHHKWFSGFWGEPGVSGKKTCYSCSRIYTHQNSAPFTTPTKPALDTHKHVIHMLAFNQESRFKPLIFWRWVTTAEKHRNSSSPHHAGAKCRTHVGRSCSYSCTPVPSSQQLRE